MKIKKTINYKNMEITFSRRIYKNKVFKKLFELPKVNVKVEMIHEVRNNGFNEPVEKGYAMNLYYLNMDSGDMWEEPLIFNNYRDKIKITENEIRDLYLKNFMFQNNEVKKR